MTSAAFELGEGIRDAMDDRDPMARFRERFYFPKTQEGRRVRLPLRAFARTAAKDGARAYLEQELKDWAILGVEGHFRAQNPWMPYHRLLTEQTAELVGAKPSEVVVMNSLTVNLHLMMVSFYRPTPKRHQDCDRARSVSLGPVCGEVADSVSTDLIPGVALIELTPRAGESCLRDEDIDSLIEREGDAIALILLGGVNYATGQASIWRESQEQVTTRGASWLSIWRTLPANCT